MAGRAIVLGRGTLVNVPATWVADRIGWMAVSKQDGSRFVTVAAVRAGNYRSIPVEELLWLNARLLAHQTVVHPDPPAGAPPLGWRVMLEPDATTAVTLVDGAGTTSVVDARRLVEANHEIVGLLRVEGDS